MNLLLVVCIICIYSDFICIFISTCQVISTCFYIKSFSARLKTSRNDFGHVKQKVTKQDLYQEGMGLFDTTLIWWSLPIRPESSLSMISLY